MNVAVFCPNWVGDLVMATPAIRALRQRFAGDQLIGVVRPYVSAVLDGGHWFDRMIHVQRGSWNMLAMAWRLRRLGIDLAVLFPNSFRSALTAWLGGCRRIVGYARDARQGLLTDGLSAERDANGQFVPSPIIETYNRLAEYVGCSSPGHRLTLHTTSDDEAAADRVWGRFQLADGETVVAINTGGAFGAAKDWPPAHFVELAQRLVDQNGSAVLFLCGPAERERAQQIVRTARRPRVCSLADEPLSLGLTKACIRRADLLVTTDSGPRHFAAAFDRPVVTLFGPTHIAWTETYHPKAIHLQKRVDCGPCQLRVCPLDHRCMTQLTPDEVYEAALTVLGRSSKDQAHFVGRTSESVRSGKEDGFGNPSHVQESLNRAS